MGSTSGITGHPLFAAGCDTLADDFFKEYRSKKDYVDRWRYFTKWAIHKGMAGIEDVTPGSVSDYGIYLQSKLEDGKYSGAGTIKSYLSAVNTIMFVSKNGHWVAVHPRYDCEMQSRPYVPIKPTPLSERKKRVVAPRIAPILILQLALGLDFKEACLLSLRTALNEAERTGRITVKKGTRHKKARRIPCGQEAINAIKDSIVVAGAGSLLPGSMEFEQFRTACFEIGTGDNRNFLSERYAYAQSRYREITNAPSPIESGWNHSERITKLAEYLSTDVINAKRIDNNARAKLITELGFKSKRLPIGYLDKNE